MGFANNVFNSIVSIPQSARIIHQYEIAQDSDAMAASAQTLRESHSRLGYGSPSQ